MINYLAAVVIITVIGVVVGALMIRRELRYIERTSRIRQEEMERKANARPPFPLTEPLPSDAPAE